MHNEKITKLEQQFFYLAQNKSKDQQAPAHKAKQRFTILLFKKFFNILLAEILAMHMALVLKPLHVSVQTQLCLTKALPRRFRGLASTNNLIKPATKGGKKNERHLTLYKETSIPIDEVFKATQNNYCLLAFSICF